MKMFRISNLSSTNQVLQERGESTSRHGRATFSVLLFQVQRYDLLGTVRSGHLFPKCTDLFLSRCMQRISWHFGCLIPYLEDFHFIQLEVINFEEDHRC